ncbi:adenylate/guanylate cyclase domain-containing protein [Prosthecomicrobium sp. N25]|uniref:adenylate/guanylate cyclase domain-containing protein n=1 Tax=Prosthecomicrobium sp. N25 TaxID=3129254 RepID=UPI0030789588
MDTQERRLVAVVAADVVGYTRLMQADAASTLAALRGLRSELVEPQLRRCNGRLVKLVGDGFLAEFRSAQEAVDFSKSLQAANREPEVPPPEQQRLVLRIGIGLGDVLVEDGDIFGDGVNMAARLEQAADPGGILISAAVHDQLDRAARAGFVFAGALSLKSFEKPVDAYRLVGQSTGASPRATRHAERPTVAVMPFEDGSPEGGEAWFSDGMTDDVTTELSRFQDVRVITRSSTSALRGRGLDPVETGRQLGAGYVLEGTTRLTTNRVSITVRLLDTAAGTQVWADRFDRPRADLFDIQDEICRSIVAKAAQRVVQHSELTARRRRPEDVRAYELFLQGLKVSDGFTPEHEAQAAAFYRQALALDPNLARAWSGLAFLEANKALEVVGEVATGKAHLTEGLAFAEKARELDPNDARTHMVAASMRFHLREFDAAVRAVDTARSVNPNDPLVQLFWGWIHGSNGDHAEAVEASSLALELTPLHPRWYDTIHGRLLFLAGRYAEAASHLSGRAYRSDARHLRDLGFRAAALALDGRGDETDAIVRELEQGLISAWRGNPAATLGERLRWVARAAGLRLPEDEQRLRDGWQRIGLPVAD